MGFYPEEWTLPACLGVGIQGAGLDLSELCRSIEGFTRTREDYRDIRPFLYSPEVIKRRLTVGSSSASRADTPAMGILKANWLLKRRTCSPAVVVLCLPFDGLHDDHIQRALDAKKVNVHLLLVVTGDGTEEAVEAFLHTFKKRPGGEDSEVPRFLLCKKGLENRFLASLLNMCRELGNDFFKAESKRIKKLRDDLNKYTQVARFCRYHFKLGYLAEARKDLDSALKYYRASYDNIADLRVQLRNVSCKVQQSLRFIEIRDAAEVVYLRIKSIYERTKGAEALAPFVLHFANFRQFYGLPDIEAEHCQWQGWLSRQCVVAAETLRSKGVPSYRAVSTPKEYTPYSLYLEAAEFLLAKNRVQERRARGVGTQLSAVALEETWKKLSHYEVSKGEEYIGKISTVNALERANSFKSPRLRNGRDSPADIEGGDAEDASSDKPSPSLVLATDDPLRIDSSMPHAEAEMKEEWTVFDGLWDKLSERGQGTDTTGPEALSLFLYLNRDSETSDYLSVRQLLKESNDLLKNSSLDRMSNYIMFLLALEYYRDGDYQQALNVFERISTAYRWCLWLRYNASRHCNREGQWTSILACLYARSFECSKILGHSLEALRFAWQFLSPCCSKNGELRELLQLYCLRCVHFDDARLRAVVESLEATVAEDTETSYWSKADSDLMSPSVVRSAKTSTFDIAQTFLAPTESLLVPIHSRVDEFLSASASFSRSKAHVRDEVVFHLRVNSSLPLDLPISGISVEFSNSALSHSTKEIDDEPIVLTSGGELNWSFDLKLVSPEYLEVSFVTLFVGDGQQSVRIRWTSTTIRCSLKVNARLSRMTLKLLHSAPALQGSYFPTIMLLESREDHVLPGGNIQFQQRNFRRNILVLKDKARRALEKVMRDTAQALVDESPAQQIHDASIASLLSKISFDDLEVMKSTDPVSFPEMKLPELRTGCSIAIPLFIDVHEKTRGSSTPKVANPQQAPEPIQLKMVASYDTAEKDHTRKEHVDNITVETPFLVQSSIPGSYGGRRIGKEFSATLEFGNPSLVVVNLTNVSPHEIVVCNVEFLEMKTTSGEAIAACIHAETPGEAVLKNEEMYTCCFMITPAVVKAEGPVGNLRINWRRKAENDLIDERIISATTTVPCLVAEIIKSAVKATLEAPSAAKQLCAQPCSLDVENASEAIVTVTVELKGNDHVFISGPKSTSFELLPNKATTICFDVLPVRPGSLPFPSISVKQRPYRSTAEYTEVSVPCPASIFCSSRA